MAVNKALERSGLLFGNDSQQSLAKKTVIVAGTGGVGSFAAEALARSGVGNLILIDRDTVEESNINRQLPALHSTVGKVKVDVLKERIADINPACNVIAVHDFYDSSKDEQLAAYQADYLLDCIDSIGSKKDLIRFALKEKMPFIISTGMARKKDPSRVQICEVEKTSYDPIAKILRTFKRKNKIRDKIMVAFSDEKPVEVESGSPLPSSIFVPATAGLAMAAKCVQDLMQQKTKKKQDLKEEKPADQC